MEVRAARDGELPAVMTVLDAAMLATSADRVREAAAAGDVLAAVEPGRVLGALVLDPGRPSSDAPTTGARIEAVAVRRRRRGQGIGTALVGAAADRHGALVAGFDEGVRPFWSSLGFEVAPAGEPGRFVGTLDPTRDG